MTSARRLHQLPGLLPFLVPALLTGGGVALPLLYLALRALEADPETLRDILLRPKNLELVKNTLSLLLGVLLFTTLIALPLAFLTTRTDLKGKRLFSILLTLPLAIPGYVGAYVILSATGPGGGSSPCRASRGTGERFWSSPSSPTPTSFWVCGLLFWGWTPAWRKPPEPWGWDP